MFRKNAFLIVLSLLFIQLTARDKTDYKTWAVKIAEDELSRNPEIWKNDSVALFDWSDSRGVFANALLKLFYETDSLNYYNAVKTYAEAYVDDEGLLKTYELDDYALENLSNGGLLFDMYRITLNPKYSKAIQYLRSQLFRQPRFIDDAFCYNKTLKNQLWLDGLYMGMPFYTRYTAIYDQPFVLYDDVVNQILTVDKRTVDKKTGLNFQAWDATQRELWANQQTGQSQNFWSAGIAMYAVSLIETLEYLPVNHPDRNVLISIFRRVVKSAAKFQDRKTGHWFQVINMKRKKDNFIESSSTAMISYALAKGINQGYIDPKYRKNAEKAFDGLLKYSTELNADDTHSFIHASSMATLGGVPYGNGSYFYYVGLPTVKNDHKLLGHLILAAIELDRMKK